MTDRLRDASPHVLARMAGSLYLLSVVIAVLAELFFRGKFGFVVAVVLPISCYAAVTVLLYMIFRVVSKPVAVAAAVFNLAGLACEALELRTRGINIGMASHGIFCVLIGFLMMRSTFLPRILGVLMAFGGVVWLLYLSPPLVSRLSPYNTVAGLLGEALPMLWLMVMGVRSEGLKQPEQAAATS
jgi:Domain of unknown function (DUF4386)